MQTGISSIDSVIGDLPSKGIVILTGSSPTSQSALIKAIGLNVGKLPGIVVSSEYGQWETPDVSRTQLGIIDSDNPINTLNELAQCDLSGYSFIIVDCLSSQSTVFDQKKIETIAKEMRDVLLLIHVRRSPITYGYNIENDLICKAEVTIKLTESPEKDKVNMSIFGKHIERKIKNRKEHHEEE